MEMKSSIILSAIILTLSTLPSFADTHYVDINNASPSTPYTSWGTAANNIQQAIDQASSGDVVLVADGHYLLSNSIMVNKDITIKSVNGYKHTIVNGNASQNCFILGDYYSEIIGFTITNGFTGATFNPMQPWTTFGGGIHCLSASTKPTIYDSMVVNNLAVGVGGIYGGTAINCLLTGNQATSSVGGMYVGVAKNCTIIGNSSEGAANCTLYNSIIFNNGNKDLYNSTAFNCCSPDLTHGVNGNITNAPNFYDQDDRHYYLDKNSPCINAGSNAWVSRSIDFQGSTRVVAETVDIGAYEWEPFPLLSKSSLVSYSKTIPKGYNISTNLLLNIWNGGGSNLLYEVSSDKPWVYISPASGSSWGATNAHNINFDTTYLPIGSHNAKITIECLDAYNSPREIDISLDVYEPIVSHFEWSSVPALQLEESPFPVYLEAIDQHGYQMVSFTNRVQLFAYSGLDNLGVSPSLTDQFESGVWNGFIIVSNYAENTFLVAEYGDGQRGNSDLFVIYSSLVDENTNGISDQWEKYYNLIDCDPNQDSDGDGFKNIDEYIAGTNPTNPALFFLISNIEASATEIVLSWNAVSGREYNILESPDLSQSGFSNIVQVISYPQSSYTNSAFSEDKGYYQVRVNIAE